MCPRLHIRLTQHDQLVHAFECPAVFDQIRRQPIQQFRMTRSLAGNAEIIRRGNKASTKMMLPQSIDHDARGKATCTLFGIGHPVCQGRASEAGTIPAFRRADLPMRQFNTGRSQNLQKSGVHDFLLLMDVAAFEQMRLRIEMRKAAIIGVVAHVRQALAGHHDFGHLQTRALLFEIKYRLPK